MLLNVLSTEVGFSVWAILIKATHVICMDAFTIFLKILDVAPGHTCFHRHSVDGSVWDECKFTEKKCTGLLLFFFSYMRFIQHRSSLLRCSQQLHDAIARDGLAI